MDEIQPRSIATLVKETAGRQQKVDSWSVYDIAFIEDQVRDIKEACAAHLKHLNAAWAMTRKEKDKTYAEYLQDVKGSERYAYQWQIKRSEKTMQEILAVLEWEPDDPRFMWTKEELLMDLSAYYNNSLTCIAYYKEHPPEPLQVSFPTADEYWKSDAQALFSEVLSSQTRFINLNETLGTLKEWRDAIEDVVNDLEAEYGTTKR